jgi:putative glutamine amidotransferase
MNTPAPTPTIRIGILGSDPSPKNERHGSGLWPAGFQAAVTYAEGTPVMLGETLDDEFWDEQIDALHGILLVGNEKIAEPRTADAEKLCEWCQEHRLPLLCVDHGLHVMNTTFNGTLFTDLAREQPEALQHRHPPEKGLRHALNVISGTRLAQLYGEGEVVVNSEHRRGIDRVARGFRVCAQALDGVIEALEAVSDRWFAMGIQWQPASSTASGLDIQVFRGLVHAARERQQTPVRRPARVAA